jgi:tetratricopeptide (TPR) repeat protein
MAHSVSAKETGGRRSVAAGVALLALLTVVTYLPALQCGFVWDDDAYVTHNPLLTASDGLQRIWLSPHRESQYFPLVYTTLRVEHSLWGLNPLGYHLVNVLLHAANACLVWLVLRRLAIPGAWLAAAIWAVHPINVESVAWITELKNTQSMLFYLLSLLAWMSFATGKGRAGRAYVMALLLYALALFSKTTACTLPAAMLLVLWIRGQKIDRRRLLQVTPFVLLGIAMGALSIWWEHHLGNYRSDVGQSLGIVERCLLASRALLFYASKLVWPSNLSFSYPKWAWNLLDLLQYRWLAGCVGLSVLLWWKRKALGRAPIAAIVYFVAALSPLLGFIPLYTFRFSFVANHYAYAAAIGGIALFAGILWSRTEGSATARRVRWAVGLPVVLVLAALTWRDVHAYRDAETIWRDTLAKNPSAWIAHNNLGRVMHDEGKISEAAQHYGEALRLNPEYADAHNNLGVSLAQMGRIPEAMEHWERALEIDPRFADAHSNLGGAFIGMGRVSDAIAQWEEALAIDPDDPRIEGDLCGALAQANRVEEAATHCESALRLDPDFSAAHNNIGVVLFVKGDLMAFKEGGRRHGFSVCPASLCFSLIYG